MSKTKSQRIVISSFFALVFAQILWGINTPVIKLGLRTVPLPLYLSVTILGAALLVAPMAYKTWKPMRRQDYILLIIGSMISITLGNVVLLMGLQRVSAVNASLIGLFGPLLLFILSVQFLKESINLRTFIGILIAFVGAAIVIGKPWGAGSSPEALTGNLLLVLSVFCDVMGTLICKPILKRAGFYQVTFVYLLAGILPIVVFSLQDVYALSPSRAGRDGYLAMAFNILAITAANCLFMYGLKHRKAQEVGIFQYIHPIATVIAAWFILAEVPNMKLIIGAIFIFVGIYLAQIKASARIRFYYHHRRA
jgi:drug/metabolite transporter (DMT)-like permease